MLGLPHFKKIQNAFTFVCGGLLNAFASVCVCVCIGVCEGAFITQTLRPFHVWELEESQFHRVLITGVSELCMYVRGRGGVYVPAYVCE